MKYQVSVQNNLNGTMKVFYTETPTLHRIFAWLNTFNKMLNDDDSRKVNDVMKDYTVMQILRTPIADTALEIVTLASVPIVIEKLQEVHDSTDKILAVLKRTV